MRSETKLFVTRAEDDSVAPFTARCRACGQTVKKRGYSGHARSHLGKEILIDGHAHRVRELIASPRNEYYLRAVAPPEDDTND